MIKSLNAKCLLFEEDCNLIESCDRIKEYVSRLGIPFQDKYLFQVDLIRDAQVATIGDKVVEKMRKAFFVLNQLSLYSFSSSLNNFIAAFSSRYEKQELPLMEVLNPEIGLGFPIGSRYFYETLIQGVKFPVSHKNGSQKVVITPFISLLQNKLQSFNVDIDDGIYITEDELSFYHGTEHDLQETIYMMFELIPSSKNEEPTLLIKSLGGGSGANLLARFAYCDGRIGTLVHDIVEQDAKAYPDAIVAEIVHVPNNRVGNVLVRPALRSHEIVYLANSIRKPEEIIYPEDLMISVNRNKIFLRSKSLNKYIYPKLTTAHNYYNDPTPLYRFLCELQHQGKRSALGFSWGFLEKNQTYLPRVYYEDIILSPCRWNLNSSEVNFWRKINDDLILFEKIREWQNKYHIPQYTYLCEGDNRLLIDWSCAKIIRIFLDEVCKRTVFILEEAFNVGNSRIQDDSGEYANECIAVFYRENKDN